LFFPWPPLYNSGDRHERIDGERFATPAKPVTHQLKISHWIFGRSSRSENAANRGRLEISRNPYRGGAISSQAPEPDAFRQRLDPIGRVTS
jgi:hypothetical protein